MTSKRRFGFRFLSALAAALSIGAIVAPSRAASVVGLHSANGAFLSAQVTSGFDGLGSVSGLDFDSDGMNANVPPPFGPPSPPITATAANTQLPFSSVTSKDIADVTSTVSFDFGAPFGLGPANDTFGFTVAGTVSAVTAMNSAGNEASAYALVDSSLGLFVDDFLFPAGTLVGTLELPAVRDLLAHEARLEINVMKNSAIIATLPAGSPAVSIDLFVGNFYQISLSYKASTPFGTDPPFSLDYIGTINPVIPEPVTALAPGLMLGGLLLRRRRSRD